MSKRAEVLAEFEEAAHTPRQRPRVFDYGELAKVLPFRTSKAEKEQERREKKKISDRRYLAKLKNERPEVYEDRKAYHRAYNEKLKVEDPKRLASYRANAKGSRKAWYAKNKKKVIAQARAWEKAHPNDPKTRARQKRSAAKLRADPVRWAKRLAYMREWNKKKRASKAPKFFITFRSLTKEQATVILKAALSVGVPLEGT